MAIRIGIQRFFSNVEPPMYPSAELNSAQTTAADVSAGRNFRFHGISSVPAM